MIMRIVAIGWMALQLVCCGSGTLPDLKGSSNLAAVKPTLQKSIKLPSSVFVVQSNPVDPYRAAVYGFDGVVRMIDFRSGTEVWHYSSSSIPASYASLDFSPDGRRVAITTLVSRSFYEVLSAATGKLEIQQPEFWEGRGTIFALPPKTAISSDNRLIATEMNQNGIIALISAETKKILAKIPFPFAARPASSTALYTLAFSRDSKFLYGSNSLGIAIWDVQTQRLVRSTPFSSWGSPRELYAVNDAALSSDARFLAVIFADGSNSKHKLIVVDTQSGLVIASLPVQGCGRIQFDVGNRFVIAMTADGWFYRFDIYANRTTDQLRISELKEGSRFYFGEVGFSSDLNHMISTFDEHSADVTHDKLFFWKLSP